MFFVLFLLVIALSVLGITVWLLITRLVSTNFSTGHVYS